MRILTKLLPNNKFQIKKYRIADGYGRSKKNHECMDAHQRNYEAQLCQKIEDIDKILKLSVKEEKYVFEQTTSIQQSIIEPSENNTTTIEKIEVSYCSLPSVLPICVVDNSSQDSTFKPSSYFEVASQRKIYLDLLKKSQHGSRKSRPWGKATKLKEFRFQAKQKILEGGAIIDRFCGSVSSTMVTLTLPGSGWYAYDCLARWSGYIVNRMTQLVRRAAKGFPPIYWFFVWEHQKRGALHMHWCIACKTSQEKRESLCHALKDKWFELLGEISDKEGIDLFRPEGFRPSYRNNPKIWQWDVQQINKSVAGYFAKYVSKNVELSDKTKESDNELENGITRKTRKRTTSHSRTCPSRYWGSSQTVKSIARRLSLSLDIGVDNYGIDCGVIEALRATLPSFGRYLGVSVVPFEVCDKNSGIVISSGTVETYIVHPLDFPAFHKYVSEFIFNRKQCMDAIYSKFMSTGIHYEWDFEGNILHGCTQDVTNC